MQPYLKHIFGDIFGFLAAWTWIVAVMPATLAILSIVFIESIFSAAGITDQAGKIEHKLLSVAVLLAVSGANSISTKTSTRLNNFFVGTKFVSIFGVVLAGIVVVIIGTSDPNKDVGGKDWATKPWFGFRDTLAPDGTTIHWGKLSEWEILGHYSAALYGALWAYSGWDKVSKLVQAVDEVGTHVLQAIYITAELSAPARQLPLAINTAIPTIILCFIATNAAYYILLPWDVISQTDSVAVVSPPPAASTSLRLILSSKDRYSSTPWSRRRHSSRNSDLSGSSGFFTWKFLRRWPHDRCGCEPKLAPSLFCLYWAGWRSIQLNYQLIRFSEDIQI